MDLLDSRLHSLIGDDGFARLVSAFYRQIPNDDILGPMYPPGDLVGAETRLRQFLIQRFGGPDTYSQNRGHPRLRARHSPFPIDQAARDRWMLLMENAMAEAVLPADAVTLLRKFFTDASTHMMNR